MPSSSPPTLARVASWCSCRSITPYALPTGPLLEVRSVLHLSTWSSLSWHSPIRAFQDGCRRCRHVLLAQRERSAGDRHRSCADLDHAELWFRRISVGTPRLRACFVRTLTRFSRSDVPQLIVYSNSSPNHLHESPHIHLVDEQTSTQFTCEHLQGALYSDLQGSYSDLTGLEPGPSFISNPGVYSAEQSAAEALKNFTPAEYDAGLLLYSKLTLLRGCSDWHSSPRSPIITIITLQGPYVPLTVSPSSQSNQCTCRCRLGLGLP